MTILRALGGIFLDMARNQLAALGTSALPDVAPSDGVDRQMKAPTQRKIVVWLVHPTNYRRNGTPRKWKRQILPSNAIGQLWGLMPGSIALGKGQLPVEKHFLEDTTQPFDIDGIARSLKGRDVKGMVMFCGIQTNQWPRALDLASLCRHRDIPVAMGGYHVRADLPFTEDQAREHGISLAIGEAEATTLDGRDFLTAMLEDLWNDRLQPVYRQQENPDIREETLPEILIPYQKMMISPSMGTLETSRGCPMPCSFCTIRTIGGRAVRARTPRQMKAWLRANFEAKGIRNIFITDDNFARSAQRFAVLELLAELRDEGFPIGCMIQADTVATAGKQGARFVEACRQAGVYAVFLGIESVDSETLKDMRKPQNRPESYRAMIRSWHEANILAQCGFIIGNRRDTRGVGRRSARALLEMGMDVAAPYLLTPLPGSDDYHDFHSQGFIHSPDFNSYDCHTDACIEFPDSLSVEEVQEEYRSFYEEFFAWRNLAALAGRLQGGTLATGIRQWLWYKAASSRGDHPMYSGLGRMKPDFVRSQFPHNSPKAVAELAPRPGGPGTPTGEMN